VKIEPALTAEQWARLHDIHGIPVEIAAVLAVENNDWHGGMALCNHALPDDDPRKLTVEDVGIIRSFQYDFGPMDEDSVRIGKADIERLQLVADKLAALLPPPTDD
jgi:hypothetical protein